MICRTSLLVTIKCLGVYQLGGKQHLTDATGMIFPCPYSTRMIVREDGEGGYNLVFRALKKQFRIIVR